MKMKIEHFNKLKAACLEVIKANPTAAQDYANAGLSHKRFNWDILNRAVIDGKRACIFLSDVIYPSGCNDTHISTALKNIMNNSGLGSNGKM